MIKMTTVIFLTVRVGSTRLPRKALLEINGKPVIEHLIDRLKLAKLADKIVLCTTVNPEDKVLIEIAKKNKIGSFRGSEEDKIDRYYHAALHFKVDKVMVVDGDDIFCDPHYIDSIIQTLKETNADYVTYRGLPLGITAHGIKFEALKKVWELKEGVAEVWGGYFTETGLFNVVILEPEDDFRYPDIRMTLDYPEDFQFFKEIFARLYRPGEIFTLQEIITLLKKNPQIMMINSILQEKYMKRIETQKNIKLKTHR